MRKKVTFVFFLTSFFSFGNTPEKVDSLLSQAVKLFKKDKPLMYEVEKQALSISKRIGYLAGEVRSVYYIGYYFETESNPVEAAEKYLETVSLDSDALDSLSKSWILSAYINVGNIFFEFGEYEQSIKFQYDAFRVADALGSDSRRAKTLHHIQRAYLAQGKLDLALNTLRKMTPFIKDGDDNHFKQLNGLGIAFSELRQLDSAKKYLNRLIELSKASENHEYYARATHNLADAYHNSGNFSRAESLFRDAVDAKLGIGDSSRTYLSLKDMATSQLMARKEKEALKTYLGAEKFLAPDRYGDLAKLFDLISMAYSKNGDSRSSRAYGIKSSEYNELFEGSASRLRRLNQREELQIVLSDYYASLQDQQTDLRNRNLFLAIIIGLASLLLIAGIYLVVTRLRTRRVINESLEKLNWDD